MKKESFIVVCRYIGGNMADLCVLAEFKTKTNNSIFLIWHREILLDYWSKIFQCIDSNVA